MHKYTNFKQRIIAFVLCITLLLTGIQIGSFQNIFATDGKYYEFDEFTSQIKSLKEIDLLARRPRLLSEA